MSYDRDQPDSGLFEILVALRWLKSGWNEVELIPAASSEKSPDIRAASKRQEWLIECKRLAKSSEYSIKERESWLRMWLHLSRFLIHERIPVILNVEFHEELEALPETFLLDELAEKLKLTVLPCTIYSNQTCTVSVKFVDLKAAQAHLKSHYVRYPSEQLNLLIAGYRDPNRGFTSVVEGKIVSVGEKSGLNRFLDEIRFAAGSFWHCDAERSIERKARDIRKHLAEAVSQLPANKKSVVHIGLETLDGALVEAKRYERICNTVFQFDLKGKDVRWIYCHLFQSYSPPTQGWVLDETVYHFSNENGFADEPLNKRTLVVPDEDASSPAVHWLRPPP